MYIDLHELRTVHDVRIASSDLIIIVHGQARASVGVTIAHTMRLS